MKQLTLLIAVQVFALPFLLQAKPAVTTTLSFSSGGKSIVVDATPASTGASSNPAIIFLYGADGMALTPWDYPTIASFFSGQGYNFYIVHYFDATGATLATPLVSYFGFTKWLQAVNDATTWVGGQPGVDPNRIAVMGMSLGASLGIADVSRDSRIKALAAWYGGVAQWYENNTKHTITHMSPTVIVHGGDDPISPLAEAYSLQTLVTGLGDPCQIKIYPNAGHALGPTDQKDALQMTLTFFQKYLR